MTPPFEKVRNEIEDELLKRWPGRGVSVVLDYQRDLIFVSDDDFGFCITRQMMTEMADHGIAHALAGFEKLVTHSATTGRRN